MSQETTGEETMIQGTMSRVVKAARILLAMLREIFDEAAYARFLDRTRMASSPEAYAAFREEFEEARARRPKCC